MTISVCLSVCLSVANINVSRVSGRVVVGVEFYNVPPDTIYVISEAEIRQRTPLLVMMQQSLAEVDDLSFRPTGRYTYYRRYAWM